MKALDALFDSKDGKEVLRLGAEYGLDIETLKGFLIQVVFDLVKDPEVKMIANANSEDTFKTYFRKKMDMAIAGRFLRNEELIEQLKVDTDLQNEIRDSVYERINA